MNITQLLLSGGSTHGLGFRFEAPNPNPLSKASSKGLFTGVTFNSSLKGTIRV